jgi:hypothetical protein
LDDPSPLPAEVSPGKAVTITLDKNGILDYIQSPGAPAVVFPEKPVEITVSEKGMRDVMEGGPSIETDYLFFTVSDAVGNEHDSPLLEVNISDKKYPFG